MENEKLTLIAEVDALKAQQLSTAEIEKLGATSEAEYKTLLAEISDKCSKALISADETRTAAIKKAGEDYDTRVAQIKAKKIQLEEQAATYYEQLGQNNQQTLEKQAQIAAEIETKQARIDVLQAEEDAAAAAEAARIKAEKEAAEAKAAAEKLAAEKAARQKALDEAKKAEEARLKALADARPQIDF